MSGFGQGMEGGVDTGWTTISAYSTPFSKELYFVKHVKI